MAINIKNTMVHIIRNNVSNKKFFEASEFHGDKEYKIMGDKKGNRYFQVKTDRGVAHYQLIGSTIGNYVDVKDLLN